MAMFKEAKDKAKKEFSDGLIAQCKANYDEAFEKWKGFPFVPLEVEVTVQ
jgi:hypothetical protein